MGRGVLTWPELKLSSDLRDHAGLLLIMSSNVSWALGSVFVRHRPCRGSHLTLAAYQMVLGGGGLTLVGVGLGEMERFSTELLTPTAWTSFFYLLVVGSLVGFVSFNYLLKHVSAPLVGTYAYVNPMIAIVVGWGIGGEKITGWTLAGMAVILVGVALVRRGTRGNVTITQTKRDRIGRDTQGRAGLRPAAKQEVEMD